MVVIIRIQDWLLFQDGDTNPFISINLLRTAKLTRITAISNDTALKFRLLYSSDGAAFTMLETHTDEERVCISKRLLFQKGFDDIQNVKKLEFEGDQAKNLFAQAILDGVFGTGGGNRVGMDRSSKVWYLLLCAFQLLLSEFGFYRGDWALGYISTQICDFSNVSLFLGS